MIHLTSGPDEPLKPSSHPVNGAPLKTPQPIRVLAVEDDYLVGLNLEQQLLDAGYEVVGIAASADQALRMATEEKPQLVIMDIRLAGTRDGVNAAIELMTKLGIPSIFATAHGDEKTRRRAAAAKPLGWLQKPYSSALLVAAIKTALTKHHKQSITMLPQDHDLFGAFRSRHSSLSGFYYHNRRCDGRLTGRKALLIFGS